MDKINYVALNSANLAVDNSVDAVKKYDINANVVVNNGNVQRIEGGFVKDSGVTKASFYSHGNANLSITFDGVNEQERVEICNNVSEFVKNVSEKVKTSKINI